VVPPRFEARQNLAKTRLERPNRFDHLKPSSRDEKPPTVPDQRAPSLCVYPIRQESTVYQVELFSFQSRSVQWLVEIPAQLDVSRKVGVLLFFVIFLVFWMIGLGIVSVDDVYASDLETN
jgi:hypothetical protein